jgi:hypothetical protein
MPVRRASCGSRGTSTETGTLAGDFVFSVLRERHPDALRPAAFDKHSRTLNALVDTVRQLEIPWATSCYQGEATVLDVGTAYAEGAYLEALEALNIPGLVGVDAAAPVQQTPPHVRDRARQCARAPPSRTAASN